MPLTEMKFYTRQFVIDHPDWFFIFGDNDARQGTGGQAAACRGLPNTIGIRTKKAPGTAESAYYTDDEFWDNYRKITEDFMVAHQKLSEGKTVVWPIDGVGTGLAQLWIRAPRTLYYIDGCYGDLNKKYK